MEKSNYMNSLEKIHQIQVALEKEQSSSYPCFFNQYRLKKDLLEAYKEQEVFWSQKVE